MPVHFSVDIERPGDVEVLTVHGDADLATVPDFATHLWRAVDGREPRILVDLRDTRFIDSKMVEVLLAAAARISRYDGKIAICCAGDNIWRVLELCGVARTMPVHASRDEALAALHV